MKRKAVFLAIFVFALLHHDFWLWDDPHLVLGFLPVGLAYHALYSVFAGLLWFLVLRYAWPEEFDNLGSPGGGTPPR